jgi:hypothetical protein
MWAPSPLTSEMPLLSSLVLMLTCCYSRSTMIEDESRRGEQMQRCRALTLYKKKSKRRVGNMPIEWIPVLDLAE